MTLVRLFLFFSNLFTGCLSSQSFDFTGKVTSAYNRSLDGVSVRIKSASVGVATDNLGNYKIYVPGTVGTFVFSSIRFIVREVQIYSCSTITITLKEVSRQLDEVVVIGYGAGRKNDLTGSVV